MPSPIDCRIQVGAPSPSATRMRPAMGQEVQLPAAAPTLKPALVTESRTVPETQLIQLPSPGMAPVRGTTRTPYLCGAGAFLGESSSAKLRAYDNPYGVAPG
jgi:hypothetical protein